MSILQVKKKFIRLLRVSLRRSSLHHELSKTFEIHIWLKVQQRNKFQISNLLEKTLLIISDRYESYVVKQDITRVYYNCKIIHSETYNLTLKHV